MSDIILIVDDSKVSTMILRDSLEEYEIFAVDSGEKMWEFLKDRIPNVILMDIMLPDCDGYELTEKLQKIEEYKNIPVIFQTAKSASEDLHKGFELGGIDFIRKPIDKLELQARVKSVLKIKKLENELRQKSITDYMTGIYNRRYFFETATKNLEYAKRTHKNLCIAMLDIDFFKKINDNFGHDAGDFVLKKFTEIISANLRAYDIFARFGGEEFVILFLDTDKEISNHILCRIKDILNNNSFEFKGKTISFTFSAGLIEFFEENLRTDIDELIKISDQRLYKAKQTGRNKVVDFD
ncbi:MAG TPA: diguanylate cyclase [Spirochaetota bacterium]|nr:diguanylate cyclase [Spirochaetota bacterium]